MERIDKINQQLPEPWIFLGWADDDRVGLLFSSKTNGESRCFPLGVQEALEKLALDSARPSAPATEAV